MVVDLNYLSGKERNEDEQLIADICVNTEPGNDCRVLRMSMNPIRNQLSCILVSVAVLLTSELTSRVGVE